VPLPRWSGAITPLTEIEDQCFGPVDWSALTGVILQNPVIAEKLIYAGRPFTSIVNEHYELMRKTHNYPAPIPLIYRFLSMKMVVDNLVAKDGRHLEGWTSLPFRILSTRSTYDVLFDVHELYTHRRVWDTLAYDIKDVPKDPYTSVVVPESPPSSPATARRSKRTRRRHRRRRSVASTSATDPKKKELSYINVHMAIVARPMVYLRVSADEHYLPSWLQMSEFDVTSTPTRNELERAFLRK
jgi:hypothetical protein